MSELIKREVNDDMTAVCLIDRDGLFTVSVNKERPSESYEMEFDYLFEAFNYFEYAMKNE